MPKMSQTTREEMDYYINPETGRITYTDLCRKCNNACKQSYKVKHITCKRYKRKTYGKKADPHQTT